MHTVAAGGGGEQPGIPLVPPGSPLPSLARRSLGQFLGLLEWKGGALPLPDVLITAVGTKIWRLDTQGGTRGTASGAAWQEDQQWARALDEGWDLGKVGAGGGRGCVAGLPPECAQGLHKLLPKLFVSTTLREALRCFA
jgi:hypothetical protein